MGITKHRKKRMTQITQMKAIFYDPYIDTIGGGERYTFTLADYLLKNGWKVIIFNGNKEAVAKLKQRFGLDLSKAQLIPMPSSVLDRRKITKDADLFFWVSDGSVPLMFSKNNILHFQVPFHGVNGQSFLNKIKFSRINHIVCNSEFTKIFIDKEFGVDSKVIYPPIDVNSFKTGKKENIILTVGRFSKLLQSKRQDILIDAFKEMVDSGLRDWKFQLAGSTDVGGREYLNELRKSAENYPIEFFENCSFETINNLYSKAKIFWYAGGYGIDEEKDPEKTEHFGMVVVEAMASGCVPVVIGKGGIKEIINNRENGYLWEEKKDLLMTTEELINSFQSPNQIFVSVVKLSQTFSKENFYKKFDEIL